jgi:hypothetical protein
MIICNKRKIGIFLPTKTGSNTIASLFKNLDIDDVTHNHLEYTRLAKNNIDIDFSSYKFYAFYRNPVERFISGYTFSKRNNEHFVRFLHYFLGEDAYNISCLMTTPYTLLSDDIKNKINTITFSDFINSNYVDDMAKYAGDLIFAPQSKWLNCSGCPPIQLLNFADFDNEILKIAGIFDLDISTVPKINQSVVVDGEMTVDMLTPEQLQKIQNRYKDDYDFFNAKGITF